VGALAVATAAVAPARMAPSGGAPLTGRAFSIRADAYPVDPAPGLNRTSIGVRPAAARVDVSNAPASAYGRAASVDAGTAELYTGPPPPGSVAECDATAPNLPREATASPGGMTLAARCDQRPSARTDATASGSGTSRASAWGDGGGDALAAGAVTEVHDAVVGEIRIGSATYTASVRADGAPGGATATGRVTVTDATIGGIPVVIGADGVTVDDTRVPLELIGAAADAVRAALSQGRYSDVRVVQPETVTAPDGTRAEVHGGGVFFYGTNADPRSNYFLQLTLVGGGALVALGGDAGVAPLAAAEPVADARPPSAGAPPPVLADAPSGLISTGAPVAAPPTTPRAGDRLTLATASARRTLARPWRGWVWVALVVALSGAVGVLARVRLARWWRLAADRYVHG
jgi:hypothetical protein